VLVAPDGDRILGFTMPGDEAGEVVAVVQTAMLAGMPYMGLRDAIIAHPTMAEGLGALLECAGPIRFAQDPSHPDQHSRVRVRSTRSMAAVLESGKALERLGFAPWTKQLEAEKSNEPVHQQVRRHHRR
jgi:hypothetical protein